MSTTITLTTDDSFKPAWLELMLDNNTASYKYYWLRAVLDEPLLYHDKLSFERLAARMVASAWYPVLYFRLRLGPRDVLADAVVHAQEACGLASSASEAQVVKALISASDYGLRRRLLLLCDYAPYHFIRPFYADRIRREAPGRIPDQVVNGLVVRFNQAEQKGSLPFCSAASLYVNTLPQGQSVHYLLLHNALCCSPSTLSK